MCYYDIYKTCVNARRKGRRHMIDVKEIKAQLKRAGMTQTDLARSVGVDPSTLNRKINNAEGETLTVKEAARIAETLKIPRDMLTNIFFASQLAETQATA